MPKRPLGALDAPPPVGLALQRAGVLVEGQQLITTPPPVLARTSGPRRSYPHQDPDLTPVITDTAPPVRS